MNKRVKYTKQVLSYMINANKNKKENNKKEITENDNNKNKINI